MAMIIKELVASDTLQTLLSNHDPTQIQQDSVAQAVKELIKAIKLLELYPSMQAIIDQFEPLRKKYPSIYPHRNFYLWQMSQACYQIVSLKLPDADFLQSNSLKCQFAFINILFDDICDLGRDKAVFDKCVLALKGQINQDHPELYKLIADAWSSLQQAIEQAPNYVLLQPVLEDAYKKWISSFEYSITIQQGSSPEQKWEDHLEIISHTGTLYVNGLIDLLFVPNLSSNQIPPAAELFLRTQKMIQLGNWVATWPRELGQKDFTSGVFIVALENGWITWNDLNNNPLEEIEQQIQNSPVESQLWNLYEQLRVESHRIAKEAQLPALDGYVDSFSGLMFILLASTRLL
jgi:hypothetical protein